MTRLVLPEEREVARRDLKATNDDIRRRVGIPGGTLIACSEDIGNRNQYKGMPERFPGGIYGVTVDTWDEAWPQDWTPWPGSDFVFVVLASFVTAGPDIEAGWLIHSLWERPDAEYTCVLLPPDFSPTKAEERRLFNARGAFFKLRPRSGRPQGSGRFETVDDFEQAVVAAVAALYNQKRAITQEAIGAFIIAKRGRNATPAWHAGDSPADPGRQFREWCTQFKRNPENLIQRTIAACANGE